LNLNYVYINVLAALLYDLFITLKQTAWS
jgi:hypothetical protein